MADEFELPPGETPEQNERMLVLDLLAQQEPTSHHLRCSEFTLTTVSPIKREDNEQGDGGWITAEWELRCSHGQHSFVSNASLLAQYRIRPKGDQG